MLDKCGRKIDYLRLSVTNRCNHNCIYCNSGDGALDTELTCDDYIKIVKACSELGISKVRLTGGEPLLRDDIFDILSGIKDICGITEIVMTTNGTLLSGKVLALQNAGLDRINISLNSLNVQTFTQITGGKLDTVMAGIREVLEYNLPLKLNVVLIKDINDSEIDDMICLTRDNDITVRFIELMPMNQLSKDNDVIKGSDILEGYSNAIRVEKDYNGQPSNDFRLPGYKGKFGVITPISAKFCDSCNRIRILSDGTIRPCLGSNSEISLLDSLSNEDKLRNVIRDSIYNKERSHNFSEDYIPNRDMKRIGG